MIEEHLYDKKYRQTRRHFKCLAILRKLLVVLVFALLVSDTAACLAGRLAGCLTFAATALLSAAAKIACLNSNDAFHYNYLH